jgi:hypothetical protein
MLNGYPGFRITSTGLLFNPRCPEGATFIKLRRLSYLNTFFDVQYTCAVDGLAAALVVTPQTDGQFAFGVLPSTGNQQLLHSSWKFGAPLHVDLSTLRDKYEHFTFRLWHL